MAALTADGRHSLNIIIAFLILGVIAVFLRFTAKAKMRTKVSESEFCLAGSMVALVAYSAILFKVLSIAGTFNTTKMTVPQVVLSAKWFYAVQFMVCSCIGLAKIGLLFFYRDVFVHRPFRRMVYAGVAFVAAWTTACTLVVAFRCTPVKAAYDISIQATGNFHCVNFGHLVLGSEITNIFSDVYLIVLPINEVRKLQMRTPRKIAVSMVFAFGIFVTATSIVRIVVSLGYGANNGADLPNVMDWSMIEMACSLICACVPGLPPLIPKRLPSVVSSITSATRLFTSSSSRQESEAEQSDISMDGLVPKPPPSTFMTRSTASHPSAPNKVVRPGDIYVKHEVSVQRRTQH